MIEEVLFEFGASGRGTDAVHDLRQRFGVTREDAGRLACASAVGAADALLALCEDPSHPMGVLLRELAAGGIARAMATTLAATFQGGPLAELLEQILERRIAEGMKERVAVLPGVTPAAAEAIAVTMVPHMLGFLNDRTRTLAMAA